MRALSARARRAVALMLVAALSLAAISLYYLRPWTAIQASLATKRVAVVPTPGIGRITNYSFISTALGWSVVTTTDAISNSQTGSYWLYKTVDAGKHWQRQLSGTTARLYLTFSSLWFADALTGYVLAGDPLTLYRTHDGGAHWSPVALPVFDLRGLQFVDRDSGFAITTGADQTTVYVTHDGGDAWSVLPAQPNNRGFWPQFRSSDEAWSGCADDRAYVYLTLDGGTTWSRSLLPTPEKLGGPMNTFVIVEPATPLVFAYVNLESSNQVSLIYSSVDQGKSWSRVTLPNNDPNGAALTALDATHWWAIMSDSTFYTTNDGGRSWVESGVMPFNLRLVKVIDSRHAWAALDAPYASDATTQLVLTSDGGVSWVPVNSPQPL